MNPSMISSNRAVRATTCISGRAFLEHGSATQVDCIIEDLSAAGACVSFPEGVLVPTYFDLKVGHDGQSYRARMMWQHADQVGVMFLRVRANAPEVILG